VCAAQVSDSGRGICRLPAAVWSQLQLPHFGWPVTVHLSQVHTGIALRKKKKEEGRRK
jgi:hypothetical protein